ncbi:hypothetical protein [Desulfobacula sp.]|uniref:hypothetical protein n=1 Tax=Desulfobacula sp. TaxID=2593537 RepID=UPI00262BD715|nr:hypothetical protein [Desulfobacula sp.]
MKIRFICIALFVSLFSTTISAGTTTFGEVSSHVKKVSPQLNKAVTSKKNIPITIETGDIEIITSLDGKHYWQIGVTNTSNRNAMNFKVYVDVEGFRNEDRVSTVGTIDQLKAERTAFARAELPDFEGMHHFRIRGAGGTPKIVEIPRPFRKDADGQPTKKLKIDRVWSLKVDGKIRWYMKTKPNIYGTILPKQVKLMVHFRERKKEYCHQEAFKKIGYLNNQQLIAYICPETKNMPINKTAIKPGESMTFFGELNSSTAKPHLPNRIDRLTVEILYGDKKSVPLPDAFFSPYKKCTDE